MSLNLPVCRNSFHTSIAWWYKYSQHKKNWRNTRASFALFTMLLKISPLFRNTTSVVKDARFYISATGVTIQYPKRKRFISRGVPITMRESGWIRGKIAVMIIWHGAIALKKYVANRIPGKQEATRTSDSRPRSQWMTPLIPNSIIISS